MGMHERQRELDPVWAEQGLAPFGLGIGLSTGEVAAAMLGSAERMEYTLVGDTVNLAQRLQDLARPAGTTVVGESTKQRGRPTGLGAARRLRGQGPGRADRRLSPDGAPGRSSDRDGGRAMTETGRAGLDD